MAGQNQALSFGLLFAGGIALTKAVTGSSFSDIVKGNPGRVSTTGQNLLSNVSSSGVAGAGQSIGAAASAAESSATPVKAGNLTASQQQVAGELMSDFEAAGLSKAGAAGIVGNWVQESALNPNEEGGYLAQWLGSRLTNLENFAASLGQPVNSVSTQAAFAIHELQTEYPGLLQELQTTTDPQSAALAVSQQYERPLLSAANNSGRQAYAQAVYNAS